MSNYLTTDGLKIFSLLLEAPWGLRPVAFATSATSSVTRGCRSRRSPGWDAGNQCRTLSDYVHKLYRIFFKKLLGFQSRLYDSYQEQYSANIELRNLQFYSPFSSRPVTEWLSDNMPWNAKGPTVYGNRHPRDEILVTPLSATWLIRHWS